jgi:hypothetical protein
MNINWNGAYGDFYNSNGTVIGHEAIEVNAWIAEHPEYRGRIWIDWLDGSRDMEVTDIFFGCDDEETDAETIQGTAREIKERAA